MWLLVTGEGSEIGVEEASTGDFATHIAIAIAGKGGLYLPTYLGSTISWLLSMCGTSLVFPCGSAFCHTSSCPRSKLSGSIISERYKDTRYIGTSVHTVWKERYQVRTVPTY